MVPRGVEHRTCADDEAEIMCFEPIGTVNADNINNTAYTVPNRISI